MMQEPRSQNDYAGRETEAAHRVLLDLGQVIGSYFADGVVLVGGWVPSLLLPDATEGHVGSIDVDLALNPQHLRDGRYAEIVKSLLATKRYRQADQQFKLQAEVDLHDGATPVVVDVDFLKPHERRRGKRLRHIENFRPLDADGCAAAFVRPSRLKIEGMSLAGYKNRVAIAVASIEDFLVMKSFALAGRDKPKDAYDICYCLEHAPGGPDALGHAWRTRRAEDDVLTAIAHLRDKFESVDSFGPQQVASFYDAAAEAVRGIHARRAFELVRRFLAAADHG
ncbi:MAG: nucleotidyl transferase AbiEii/AbiGii toxin family protein [Planctomycetes bacterium]|nr:nucleotidyl transferase AbiEii/AbiGii toxin family protein [Planctomycetota bacterium]